jgi:hypothetical protein
MERCALVSVNGGWNLLIGAQSKDGSWAEIEVPDECSTVWSESEKDVCFEHAARRGIAEHPWTWLSKVPRKVGVTLDYFGAAPWYLHASNPEAFGERAKVVLATAETVVSRLLLIASLVAAAWLPGPRMPARRGVAVLGAVAAATRAGWLGYVALVVVVLLLGRRALARAPLVIPWTAAVVAATVLVHAVFFGAGRYGLVVVPFVTALAFVGRRERGKPMPPVESESARSSDKSDASS